MTMVSPVRTVPAGVCADVDDLITSHIPLVHHLVREVLGRVPAHVDRDDLVSAGMLALTVAGQGFDASRGVPFAAFASIRIRGALTDELRSMDWASRAVRSRARDIDSARSELTARLGRVPNRTEVASVVGLSEHEIDNADQDVRRAGLLSMQALTPAGQAALPCTPDSPESITMQREQVDELRRAIDALPERLRIVVEQYFFEHKRMGPIAAQLGVTESRVSQLRSEALLRLKAALAAA